MVENNVSIALMAGCKYNYFAYLWEFLEESDGMGSDVDSSIDLFARRKLDLETDIMGQIGWLIAMNEGLIQIQD